MVKTLTTGVILKYLLKLLVLLINYRIGKWHGRCHREGSAACMRGACGVC